MHWELGCNRSRRTHIEPQRTFRFSWSASIVPPRERTASPGPWKKWARPSATSFQIPNSSNSARRRLKPVSRHVPFQEANAIVVILDAERLRFVDMEATGPRIETVEGSVIRISGKDDISLPHVARLCAEICRRAPAANQKWLIVSRGYGFGAETPACLAGLENLAISEVQNEGHDIKGSRTTTFSS